jgi:hypothetical protein
MNESIEPRKVQSVVKAGFERMKKYQRARAMFIKEAVGQYYAQEYGLTGDCPVNLIFSAIRAMIPVIVSQNPTNTVETDFLEYKSYAELLSLGLDKVERRCGIKELIRGWAVQAMFAMGIMKVGIAASGNLIQLGDSRIDPGDIYLALTNFDDFVIDPMCTNLYESSFMGHKTCVPRQYLLDTNGIDHDLVRELPSADGSKFDNETVANLSRQRSGVYEMEALQDMVDVVELWVPEADALVMIPDPYQVTFDKYLGVSEYYGPASGPYEFLSFTPPVDDNPFPVAPVSLYFDLHRATNRVFNKELEKAENQRDMLLYKPSHADIANDIVEGRDGDSAACDDPNAVKVVSFGGAQNRNGAEMLSQLQLWFNYMAGNPDQIAGQKSDARSATQANILQSNAMISVEDAKDILYDSVARLGEKIGWYLHNDPLLNIVLAKREPGQEAEQITLTPEQRVGGIEDFTFKIKPKSMGKLPPQERAKRITDFLINITPSIVNTAVLMVQLGLPFNVQAALTMAAEELEIGEWMQEVFYDPMFQQKMMLRLAMGGGQAEGAGGGQMSGEGIKQQGGFPGQRPVNTPQQDTNQFAQDGAAEQQSMNQGLY